jgi:hypothetical protein
MDAAMAHAKYELLSAVVPHKMTHYGPTRLNPGSMHIFPES